MTQGTLDSDWLYEEMATFSLGDARLDYRLLDTGAKLTARPGVSINQACDDWADTKASYRLFDNKKTTAAKILQPHYQRTAERAASQERIFAVQDTCFLDYSHHPSKKGLGPIGTTQQKLKGLVIHNALLVSEPGTPLGLIDQAIWTRPEEAKQMTPDERRLVPIEEKESYKWLSALSRTVERAPTGPQLITIGDSEADIFELFDHARSLETDLLIRAGQDRSLCEPEVGRLWDTLEAQPVSGTLQVDVPAQRNRPKRTAELTVRFASVSLRPPKHLRQQMGPIPLYAVLAWEENPAADVDDPICWLLLTTVPVTCFEEAVERVGWYKFRWLIEIYFKVLKSGCRVEETQLATKDRLLPFIALLSIIAWRLFWMTMIARHDPDAPATVVLAEHEWQALYVFHHKAATLPANPPSVRQVMRWMAQLGGFLARKHDHEPGVTVIWRGWQRLSDISASWLLFHHYPYVGKG
jgi:hypothetical protein